MSRNWRVRPLTDEEQHPKDADLLFEAERGNLFVGHRTRLHAYMKTFPEAWTAHYDRHMGWICVHRNHGVWYDGDRGGPAMFESQGAAEEEAGHINSAELRMRMMQLGRT